MSATAKGRDMAWETFRAAVEYDEGGYVTLGGGEPTLHPQFEKFLFYAIGKCESVWLATNGGITETALVLANMARKGIVAVDLSLDPWHDPIDPKVVEAFTRPLDHEPNDARQIRRVSGNVIRQGRAARRNFWEETKDGCVCEDFVVKPDGTVRQCGCPKSPCIGDVFKGWKGLEDRFGNRDMACHKTCKKSVKAA
jgi:hypothetical protein